MLWIESGCFAKGELGGHLMSQSNLSHLSMSGQENLLTPAEVAALFRVDPKTVTRWAKAGKLTSIRTLGGHRRYKESEVKSLLNSIGPNTSSNRAGGN
jgi:excisionase family DNA binding protein